MENVIERLIRRVDLNRLLEEFDLFTKTDHAATIELWREFNDFQIKRFDSFRNKGQTCLRYGKY